MSIGNLATKMRDMAKHCISVNHTENKALAEVAALLEAISAPARLLTFEEIEQLPEFAVVWEEWRGWAQAYGGNALEIAPVARMGNGLAGNSITSMILPENDGRRRRRAEPLVDGYAYARTKGGHTMTNTPNSSRNAGPDCLNCWKRETCARAKPGTFCTRWQSRSPQPKGKNPNQAWREGDEPAR